MSLPRCICRFPACKEDGADATLRLPQDDQAINVWLATDDQECSRKHQRVCHSHFPQISIVAGKEGHGVGGAVVRVRVRDGALPTVSNDAMRSAAKGALGQFLKSQAVAECHVESMVASAFEIDAPKAKIAALESAGRDLKDRLKERAKGGGPEVSTRDRPNYSSKQEWISCDQPDRSTQPRLGESRVVRAWLTA